jgi:hypothetical protein
MLQISTNRLSQRKNVEIDGHHYIVRRMGAGDQLSISQYMRELTALSKKETDNKLTKQDQDRVAEIELEALKISARCFDDQGDGTKALELVKSLSPDELTEMMQQIFDEPKTIEQKSDEPEAKAS